MIELTRVTKCFNAGRPNRFMAVDEVSLTIRRGKITILKGPSGSGKTTLLSLVGCMSRPTSGRIRLRGVRAEFMPGEEPEGGLDITALPERFLTEIRRCTYGFIFQQFNLIKGITVLENIMLPTYPAGLDHASSRRRALELLRRFEITRLAGSPVDWLSGGELQRVAFARALINDPAVVIADEPTAHLDSRMSRDFMETVGGFREGGKTVLIASHDPIVYDSPLADTVIEMRDGRLMDRPSGFMIQHPGIIALTLSSALVSLMLAYAGWHGFFLLRRWDPQSGLDRQLDLERRTYLISTIVGYALAFQILSLFLFVFTADVLHSLFVGSMCAAGTLNVNGWGYPTMILKIFNSLLAGIWLIVNHADTRGYDYPLIRFKYRLLMLLVPLVLFESFLQSAFFSGLHPDVITSCCGSLFGTDSGRVAGEIAALPAEPLRLLFYGSMGATVAWGAFFSLKGRGAFLFSLLSTASFLVASASLISFLCLYFYELPTHHCPFCILQREYGFVGYPLYACLLGGAASGVGVGVLAPFRSRKSLALDIPRIQRFLAVLTLALYTVFTFITTWRMLATPFRLGAG